MPKAGAEGELMALAAEGMDLMVKEEWSQDEPSVTM